MLWQVVFFRQHCSLQCQSLHHSISLLFHTSPMWPRCLCSFLIAHNKTKELFGINIWPIAYQLFRCSSCFQVHVFCWVLLPSMRKQRCLKWHRIPCFAARAAITVVLVAFPLASYFYRVQATGIGWRERLLSTLPHFWSDEPHVCKINHRVHYTLHLHLTLTLFAGLLRGDFSKPRSGFLAAKANEEGFSCDVIA